MLLQVEESSIQLGVPIKNIYPVKNYHAEITEDKDVDVIILMALMDIVNFASDYVENMYEQSDHWITGLYIYRLKGNSSDFSKVLHYFTIYYLIFLLKHFQHYI